MVDQVDTIRPGSLHTAEEDFSSEEVATQRKPRNVHRGVYAEAIPPTSPLPSEFLRQPSSGRRSSNSSGINLGNRANALAAVSGRAIGIIEGTAVRVELSDPALAHELRTIASELWASLTVAVK